MQPTDADGYFGKVLRDAKPSTRTGRAAALTVFFEFLELRHKVELYNLTGGVVECPLDEMNRPRSSVEPLLRVPPDRCEIEQLFAGWRQELVTCRKFGPAARNYAAARLAADVGLRVNETRILDLDDVRWELGRFGKLNVRFGKGSRRRGPKPRLVPLINGADRTLRWFVEDVWGHFDLDHTRIGVPLFPSERKNTDGSGSRATDDVFRRSLAEAAEHYLPSWAGKLTPHVLRHFCASQLYLGGMSLFAIQELLGHGWTGTTARYVHVQASHVEEGGCAGSSGRPSAGRDLRHEVEPAAGRRQPRHLEGQRDAAPTGRARTGDQRREDVRLMVRAAEHSPPGRAGRDLRGARLRRRELLLPNRKVRNRSKTSPWPPQRLARPGPSSRAPAAGGRCRRDDGLPTLRHGAASGKRGGTKWCSTRSARRPGATGERPGSQRRRDGGTLHSPRTTRNCGPRPAMPESSASCTAGLTRPSCARSTA